MAALELSRASLPPPETALRIARRGLPPPSPLSPSTTTIMAAHMRPRHTRALPSLLGAALIVAVAVLAHVAVFAAGATSTNAAVAASGTSKPAPSSSFVDSNGQPFAACMSSNPNTAYCPHNAGNSEQPEAAKTYNTTSMLRMTWNSKWPSFATTGAVDLYLCPTDGTKCIPMDTAVSVSVEIVDALIDPAKVKPGRYTYVVVPLNNKPEDTSFGERGVELVIQAGPSTSTTSSASSTASPTATSSVGPVPIPTASVLAKSDGNEDNGGLTTLQLALIIAAAAAALIGLALLLIARRRRHQRRLKAGAVAGTSGSAKSAGGIAVVAVPAGAAAAAPYDVLRETASAEKVGTGGTVPRTAAETPVATAAVPGAASAAAITPATPDGLTALNGSAVNLTPPGAISNADAILIANSFKLALKKSIDDDDDDEDIHTMINNLGMRPVPSGDPNEPFMFMTTSVPPTAVASGAAAAAGLIPPPPPPPSSSTGAAPPAARPSFSSSMVTSAAAAGAPPAITTTPPTATRHGSLPRQGSLLSDAGVPSGAATAAVSPHMRLGVARTSDLGASTGTIDSLLAASTIAAAPAAAAARASPSPSSLASPPSAVHDRIVVERVSMDHRDREQLLLNRHAAVKLVKSNPCLVVGPIAGSSSGGAGSDRENNGGGGAISEAATPMTRTPSTRSDAALVEDAAGGVTPPSGPSRA
ncbi:hypothetical protein AMAG_08858 [Allomyces macrogynus ATCC 38327]|uniref:Uncharacterized protein n=1 Tax=Allomyces macrogynus (strain ATCC 38327) TaxID=578462 RepID=A0A0L0SMR8_ALLM3|nr:hypothetical protein AMAG_08858 [Allomyces macrogynus ATCC 38327]|eukprot:KNE63778.1 hypothetical protein AMAG_08858 [Allomyces macrogynus ATCC 38327]